MSSVYPSAMTVSRVGEVFFALLNRRQPCLDYRFDFFFKTLHLAVTAAQLLGIIAVHHLEPLETCHGHSKCPVALMRLMWRE